MAHQDDSSRKSTKNKLVDLQSVAALLDDSGESEDNNKIQQIRPMTENQKKYSPDEELIQETSRIKAQRDLIIERIEKMQDHTQKVSKSVFEKVRRDYLMQMESITNLLNERKAQLHKELKDLYMLREKQTFEINRHKEILEEARFRHFLDEFSEEQFKEVEEYESREIQNRESGLAHIQAFIKIHEELFDPEDLGLSPRNKTTEPLAPREETKTFYREAPQTVEPQVVAPQTARIDNTKAQASKSETVIRPEEPALQSEAAQTPPPPESPLESSQQSSIDYFETDDASDPSVTVESPNTNEEVSLVTQSPVEPSFNTGKTLINQKSGPASMQKSEPESIFDVIEDMPLEHEVAQPKGALASESGASIKSLTSEGSMNQYKLVFTETETELDFQDFPIRDNISIGRSPSNDLVLSAPKVSRQHAAINKYNNQYLIIDLKSSNGILVNGAKVEEHPLENGDEITIGGYKMIFKAY